MNAFKWAILAALHHHEIGKDHSERISKLEPYSKQYNWKNISFPAKQDDWKKFERNNPTVALNVLYIDYEGDEEGEKYLKVRIKQAYISKHNTNSKKDCSFTNYQ